MERTMGPRKNGKWRVVSGKFGSQGFKKWKVESPEVQGSTVERFKVQPKWKVENSKVLGSSLAKEMGYMGGSYMYICLYIYIHIHRSPGLVSERHQVPSQQTSNMALHKEIFGLRELSD